MPTTIKLKNSVTTTNAPSSLAQGEVAINVTDKKVWVGNAATTPVQLLGTGADGSLSTLTVGAGTVSAPAITTSGDTNTGIFFPAADTIAFAEGGTEAMRIDSSGNVGIGTASPAQKLHVASAGTTAIQVQNTASSGGSYFKSTNTATTCNFGVDAIGGYVETLGAYATVFYTNSAQRMIIDSSGNVGIGTSSPTASTGTALHINNSGGGQLHLTSTGSGTGVSDGSYFTHLGTELYINNQENGPIFFYNNNTERMRIDSSGNLLVGTTTFFGGKTTSLQTASNLAAGYFINSSSPTGQGVIASYTNATASGSAIGFILGSGNGSTVTTNNLFIYTNGNVVNTNNSYGAISDIKLKENIVDSSPKLIDLCKVKVRNYNLIKDESKTKQLGVIAQELEEIFPSLIEIQPDKDIDGNDLGTVTKQVKYSVFVPMLIKAIQEQQAIITDLKSRIEALESK